MLKRNNKYIPRSLIGRFDLPFIQNRQSKLTIVGLSAGRCGTAYCSKLLTKNGFNIGHEEIFTPRGPNFSSLLIGDVSWLAVPYIGTLSCQFFTVSREPSKVISSFLEIGFFRKDYSSVYKNYAKSYFEFTGHEGEDAVNWYIFHMKKSIMNSIFHYKTGVTPPDELLDFIEDIVGIPDQNSPRIVDLPVQNKKENQKKFKLNDIVFPLKRRSELMELAELLGYSNENVQRLKWR